MSSSSTKALQGSASDSSTKSNKILVATIKSKKSGREKIWFWSAECKYDVITNNAKALGWKLVDDEKKVSQVSVYWIDVATIGERFKTIQPWQMINHFPGMTNVARKNRMGQNLNKMLKLFPTEYAFYPRTWVLPGELSEFRANFDAQGNSIGNKIYIIKPDTGCQGRGIFLTRTFDTVPQGENVVAQLYIKKPLLLDGYKFDLRLYCLVTSVKPLRMYLFHDGLVRMCTEEYMQPTKQNLENSCMHLTNYAVNKHNSNFQQPTAASSEEFGGQEDAVGKRSLLWFMNWVREESGEAKASWLWRRMGTLCVRTVMSIMPILSREYDQHFKSWGNVPVRTPKVSTSRNSVTNFGNMNFANSSSNHSGHSKDKNDNGDNEDEDDDDDDADEPTKDSQNNTTNNKENNNDTNNNNTSSSSGPKMRGSRCFEVLGFDIMIDHYLKPWLIEVNHLPSFGTDSPLDLDIKTRLMQQVLSALPLMSDDEQAYALHHKMEAEKRLTKKKEVKQPPNEAPASKNKERPRGEKEASTLKIESDRVLELVKEEEQGGEEVQQPPVVEAAPIVQEPDPIADDSIIQDGECTAERMEEIKKVLIIIYIEYSPEKVNKIDRLLAKYKGREEEFLRFVHHKYNVTPFRRLIEPVVSVAPTSKPVDTKKGVASNSNSSNIPCHGRNSLLKSNKKNPLARSLSPPHNRGRSNASWKVLSVEDDENLKQEVLATHVPQETDEWMVREMSYLSQFTRIYPPEPRKDNDGKDISSANEETVEEDEDANEEEEENKDGATATGTGGEGLVANANTAKKAKVKPASYEDILYRVFLHDKKQMMRFRCPIGNGPNGRDRLETSSLPPLGAASNSSTSNNRAMNTGINSSSQKRDGGSGGVYSKPKEIVKVPTRTQIDAASRLSQGLSVANLNPSVYRTNSSRQVLPSAPMHVVLDEDMSYIDGSYMPGGMGEYDMIPGYGGLSSGGSVMSMGGASMLGGGLATANNMYSSQHMNRANKMFEDGRLSRLRLEMGRPTPASVLRQQVFRFDDNNSSNAGSAMHVGIGNNPLIYPGGDISGLHQVVLSSGQVIGSKYAPAIGAPKQMSYANGTAHMASSNGNGGRNLNKMSAEQMFPEWF